MRSGTTNNFDAIRLVAASMVLCSHQFALLGQPEPQPFGLLRLGTLGVLMFFSLSGYLVAQSWERDPHPWRFAVRRFLRIWPALAVVVVLAAVCMGPAYSTLPAEDYFRSTTTWRYLRQLYLQTELFLPGVFETHPIKVVNGSLWTIPIEVSWYGILLIAGICGLLRERARYVWLAIVAAYAVYIYAVFDVQHNPLAGYLQPKFGTEYGSFFCYGVVLHRWRHVWRRHVAVTLLAATCVASVAVWMNHAYAALFVLLPLLVVWLGQLSTPVLRGAGRFGDLSYGIYIYAFLVQQAVIAGLGVHHSYALMLALSMGATLVCAWLSWHLIERPVLSLKQRLRNPGSVAEPVGASSAAWSATP